jgi:hypothetical protein
MTQRDKNKGSKLEKKIKKGRKSKDGEREREKDRS